MKTKGFFSVLFIVLLLCPVFTAAMAEDLPPRLTCGDFVYDLLPDGTAEIALYCGSDADIVIPAELDGHPVTSVGAIGWNLGLRFGNQAPGVYISIDDVNALAQDPYFLAQFADQPDDVRAAWIEKLLPESARDAMICFLARRYMWDQGISVITDVNSVTGEPRDSEQYKEEKIAYLLDHMSVIQAEIAEKQAVLDDPATAEKKANAYRKMIENRQAELSELEAEIEKIRSTEILTDSTAKARWTESTGITASANDAETLFTIWQDAFESLVENHGVPDAFPSGIAFISSENGLNFSSQEINIFQRMIKRLQMLPPAIGNGENSSYIRLDNIPRVVVVPPLLHSVVISEGITHIGDNAFTNLFGMTWELTNVSIPASVTSIGNDIFHGCSPTVTVIAGSYAEQYCTDHGIPFVYADPQN